MDAMHGDIISEVWAGIGEIIVEMTSCSCPFCPMS